MMSQNLQMQLDVMESIQKKTGICPFGAADEGGKRLLLPADDADDALLQEILRYMRATKMLGAHAWRSHRTG